MIPKSQQAVDLKLTMRTRRFLHIGVLAFKLVFLQFALTAATTTLPVITDPWEQAHLVIIDKDTNSVFLNANERFLETLRPTFPQIKTVDDLIGKNDFDFYSADLANKFRTDDRRVLDSKIPFETVEDNQPLGGIRMSYRVSKSPLRHPDGTIFGLRITSLPLPQIQVRSSVGSVEVSYARNSADFALQRSGRLGFGANWETIPVAGGGTDPVSVTLLGGSSSYFRLAHFPQYPETWKPDRPITLVVPFTAGGSSDQLARLLVAILEPALGQKIAVVNLTGAAGVTGTAAVLSAPRDGYTWRAGGAAELSLYKLLGTLNTSLAEWNAFVCLPQPAVFAVNASSFYQTLDQLVAAFRANPGALKVGTVGPASTGGIAMQLLASKAGVKFTTVVYNGGIDVANACAAGEIDAMAQSIADTGTQIRSGKIRALANLSSSPLAVEGLSEPIPPASRWVHGLSADGNYFGIFLPKQTPPHVIATLQKLWDSNVAHSSELQAAALRNGAGFATFAGARAQAEVLPYLQPAAWALFDAGVTKFSPEVLGIPRP